VVEEAGTATLVEPVRATAEPTTPSAAPTVKALSVSDVRRSRTVAGIGAVLCAGGALTSLFVDGDPTARMILLVGLSVVALTNGWLFWLVRDARRLGDRGLMLMWTSSALGVLSAVPFVGMVSGIVAALLLVIVLVSLGQSRPAALSAYLAIAIGYAVLVALTLIGVIPDRGIVPMPMQDGIALPIVGAVGLQLLFAAAFLIVRWSRRNTLAAFAELERSARAVAQREALDEARDLARVLRAGRLGRFSERVLGSYRVGEIIGRGAMGEVYEAHRESGGGDPVAIKVMHEQAASDPARLARFRREATAIGALDSPHVVRILEVSEQPVPYLVMERLRGTDLAAVLRERPTLTTAELIRLVDDVARGLEDVRRAGLVHRDLKPQNVFLMETTRRWKILDFGIAKLAGSDGTLTGDRIVGTPGYMAPEQVSGGAITHATDVYGLAALTYRCTTGRPPFSGAGIEALLFQVAHARPRRPSALANVERGVDAVLAIGLARRAEDRFPTASAFAHALSTALTGGAVPPEPPNAWA
jgi:serine/threonine-protein kinase